MVLLGDSWLQLMMAGVLGVVLSQLGFLGHEAAHRQMFRSPHWNEWVARVLSTLMVGLSYGWWMNKHNRHHANPNKMTNDPDVNNTCVALTPESVGADKLGATGPGPGLLLPAAAPARGDEPARRFGPLPFPVPGPSSGPSRSRSWCRIVGCPVFLFCFFPSGLAAAFLGVQFAVFGFLLGAAFAPNHIAMPIVPADSQLDFVRRQVLMSRNISGGPMVRFFMGGLENQVEHHLFPMMARPNLKRAQQIVREHCRSTASPTPRRRCATPTPRSCAISTRSV